MVTGLIVKVAALALALVITSKAEASMPAPSVVRRPCSVVVGSGVGVGICGALKELNTPSFIRRTPLELEALLVFREAYCYCFFG